MEIRRFLALVASRWPAIVGITVAAAVIALAASMIQAPTYEARARLLVTAGLGTGAGGTDAVINAPRVGQTYAILATTRPVLEDVIASLKLGTTPEELTTRVTSSAAFDAPFVTITVDDRDAARSAATANALTAQLVKLSTPPAGSSATAPLLEVAEPAAVPDGPIAPRVVFNTILATSLGFFVSLVLVMLWAYLRNDTNDETRDPDVPVLGTIRLPRARRTGSSDYVAELEGLSGQFAETLEVLAHSRTATITGSGDPALARIVAIGLAVAAARAGRRVLLVDGDVRAPMIHEDLGVTNDPGFTTLLAADGTAAGRVARPTTIPRLRVIPAGSADTLAAELVTSPRLTPVLAELESMTDLVVILTAPAERGDEAARLASRGDTALVVAEAGRTADADAAVRSIRGAGATVRGVVTASASRAGDGWSVRSARPLRESR
ncbi:MAG TPA: hypothetical protein VFI28_13785 [Candidatus Limnocylindrales bacterium]|nr:hypothetical protein [Candidatus Limnocylindrales bacterium]